MDEIPSLSAVMLFMVKAAVVRACTRNAWSASEMIRFCTALGQAFPTRMSKGFVLADGCDDCNRRFSGIKFTISFHQACLAELCKW
jgi:hypothetical protein